jgi:hypothetical protein
MIFPYLKASVILLHDREFFKAGNGEKTQQNQEFTAKGEVF